MSGCKEKQAVRVAVTLGQIKINSNGNIGDISHKDCRVSAKAFAR